MQPPPLPDHWNRDNPLQYATLVRNPARLCIYCQHVDVRVLIPPVRGYTRSLRCEKNRGHAGEQRYHVCCDWQREPGSDDESLTQG